MKATVKAPTRKSNSVPGWAQIVIAAHLAAASEAGVYVNEKGEQVSVEVSHAARMKSRRYFCWEEDETNEFIADNKHDEVAVSGYTDLFTEMEFDPAVKTLGEAFDAAEISWERTSSSWEPDARVFHYIWEWEVI